MHMLCVGRVTAQCRRNDFGSRGLGQKSIIERRDVRTDLSSKLQMNLRDNCGPGFGLREAPLSAVERDDIRACITH